MAAAVYAFHATLTLIALASAAASLLRFGRRGLWSVFAAVAGLLLSCCLLVAFIGVSEGVYAWLALTPATLTLLGVLGIVLLFAGVLGSLRRNPYEAPGGCRKCGYDLSATAPANRCPECGVTPGASQ